MEIFINPILALIVGPFLWAIRSYIGLFCPVASPRLSSLKSIIVFLQLLAWSAFGWMWFSAREFSGWMLVSYFVWLIGSFISGQVGEYIERNFDGE